MQSSTTFSSPLSFRSYLDRLREHEIQRLAAKQKQAATAIPEAQAKRARKRQRNLELIARGGFTQADT